MTAASSNGPRLAPLETQKSSPRPHKPLETNRADVDGGRTTFQALKTSGMKLHLHKVSRGINQPSPRCGGGPSSNSLYFKQIADAATGRGGGRGAKML